jgi:hypothetical protein
MPKIKFFATFDKKTLLPKDFSKFMVAEFTSQFEDGERIEVTFDTCTKRSLEQNATLHWWIGLIAEFTGNTPERVKKQLKFDFLRFELLDEKGEYIVDKHGEVMYEIRDTRDLKTHEMSKFMNDIQQWSIEFLDYELPLPNKTYKMKF